MRYCQCVEDLDARGALGDYGHIVVPHEQHHCNAGLRDSARIRWASSRWSVVPGLRERNASPANNTTSASWSRAKETTPSSRVRKSTTRPLSPVWGSRCRSSPSRCGDQRNARYVWDQASRLILRYSRGNTTPVAPGTRPACPRNSPRRAHHLRRTGPERCPHWSRSWRVRG